MTRPKVGDRFRLMGGEDYILPNVVNLKAESLGENKIAISLQDPDDVYHFDGTPIAIQEGTMIRGKQGNYPVSEKDGTLFVDYKAKDTYKSNPFVTDELEEGEWFFMAFPYTDKRVFTIDAANRVSAIAEEFEEGSWKWVQSMVRKGLANEHFEVGDQLITMYDNKEVTLEVIGIDVDTPTDSNYQHSMTLQFKDIIDTAQWENGIDSTSKQGNRYIQSAMHQWLNSDDANFVWEKLSPHGTKPTSAIYNGGGFLYKLDPELVSVLGEVVKRVGTPNWIQSNGQDVFNAKAFLLSQYEVDLGTSEIGNVTDEFIYPFYQGKGNANRIKQLNGTNTLWWTRSAYVSYSNRVRHVHSDGTAHGSHANNTHGVPPACVII